MTKSRTSPKNRAKASASAGSISKKQGPALPAPRSKQQQQAGPRQQQQPLRPATDRSSATGSGNNAGVDTKRVALKRGIRNHHPTYNKAWVIANAPSHLHPPKPAYSGPEDTHKYLHYSMDSAPTVASVAAGEMAVLFFDLNDQLPTFAHGSWVRPALEFAALFNTDYLFQDLDTFRDAAKYRRSLPPAGQMQLRSFPQVGGTGYNIDAPNVNEANKNDQMPKVQLQLCTLQAQVSVPFGGACTTSVVSAGTRHEFCGDNTRRIYGDKSDNSETDPDPYIRPVYKIPNALVAATTDWKDELRSSSSTSVQMGASDTATMTHKATLQQNDGWHTIGRTPFVANSRDNVLVGAHPSNLMYCMSQGCIIIDNTGSDPVTVMFRGKAAYAITRIENYGSVNGSALITSLLGGASSLTNNPVVKTGDVATHSHTPGQLSSTPPKDNNIKVPDHSKLAADLEGGITSFGAMKMVEESGFGAKMMTFGKSLASRAKGFVSKYGATVAEDLGAIFAV